MPWMRVTAVRTLAEEILENGCRSEVVACVGEVARLTVLLSDRAQALVGAGLPTDTNGKTITTAVPVDPESRLLTADEAAVLAGPSFTAKRLYRLRGDMPMQAWVRKGGRLYFRDGPFRRWLAMR